MNSLDSTVFGTVSAIKILSLNGSGVTGVPETADGFDEAWTVRRLILNVFLSAKATHASGTDDCVLSWFGGIYCGGLSKSNSANIPDPSFSAATDGDMDWLWLGSCVSNYSATGGFQAFEAPSVLQWPIDIRTARKLTKNDGIFLCQNTGFVSDATYVLSHLTATVTVSSLLQRTQRH